MPFDNNVTVLIPNLIIILREIQYKYKKYTSHKNADIVIKNTNIQTGLEDKITIYLPSYYDACQKFYSKDETTKLKYICLMHTKVNVHK